MKVKGLLKAVLFSAVVFLGCAAPYTPAPQIIPSHIKAIYVRQFVNMTNQFGIEDKLTLKVVDEFVRDGRIKYAMNEENADGVVVGEITKYILQPLTYDSNMVAEQYKLWVLLNVHFVDKVNNVTMWTESNMEGIQIFYDPSRGGKPEEEVREELWDLFARDIIKRTYEGFGSVSGASEKKVPTK
ncbi:MAG: hypothetical protein JW803_06815 [Endomicrobiales bacterium]|nr:hypothetical protein [Endomicrobiales bacterium]